MAGGNKASSARTPSEAPNSLQAFGVAAVLDVISEGPIRGLVDDDKSIFLNGTPVRNNEGTANFDGFKFVMMGGYPDQPALDGLNQVETPVPGTPVGTAVKKGSPGPITVTIPDGDYNAVRCGVAVQGLFDTDTSSGDIRPSSVTIALDLKASNTGFVQVVQETIEGKTTSSYQRDFNIRLAGPGPWQVRFRRITDDSTRSGLVNGTAVGPVTAITEQRFSYPDTAYGVSVFRAEQFGTSVPARGFEVYGRIVKVPSNYFPGDPQLHAKRLHGCGCRQPTGLERHLLHDLDRQPGLGALRPAD